MERKLSLRQFLVLIKEMGVVYVVFRLQYYVKKKIGYFQLIYPKQIPKVRYPSLKEWQKNAPPFFFSSKSDITLPIKNDEKLRNNAEKILNGNHIFFSCREYKIETRINWFKNVHSGFCYNANTHWSKINEINTEAGDIKFVWELSRFCFLYTLIRYDYHFQKDLSQFVLQTILDWIKKNKYNKGPNFICSQEISLRILNWTFALYYYKNSKNLSEQVFHEIIHSIREQIIHVYQNINYSRLGVKNNHAITETLALYLIGLLFPFFPESKKLIKHGKKWFEQEIERQIYNDGTYLQFSMNYHRVVVQLLTWGIRLSELNNQSLHPIVLQKAERSLNFLYCCLNMKTGELPNYGANDGALFFPLNNDDFRNYKNQLFALARVINMHDKYAWEIEYPEDVYWYGYHDTYKKELHFYEKQKRIFSYPIGGYYLIKEKNSVTFIRCGKHKDRPSHADNLHVDIWYEGINYFRDNGSYLYNTEEKILKYYTGTASHNTVMLEDYDQMLKFKNFMWLYWTQAINASLTETNEAFIFDGEINAFIFLNSKILHKRKIVKYKDKPVWEIFDFIENADNFLKKLNWHPNPQYTQNIECIVKDQEGNLLQKEVYEGRYSPYYSYQEPSIIWQYKTYSRGFLTRIEILT